MDEQKDLQNPVEEQPVEHPEHEVTEQASKPRFPLFFIALICIVLLGIVGWFGYTFYFNNTTHAPVATSQNQVKKYPGKVVIGYVTWPGYLGLYLARDKGFFKADGVAVELRLYQDILVAQKDYVSGKIQGIINVPLATVGGISGTDTTVPQKIVLATDYSNGADGIIAKSSITRVDQLKGKRVAFQKNTIEEAFTKYALAQYNLTFADITPVDLDPMKAADALAKGQVDAATTYEPFISMTAKQIHGNILYTSANAPGLITDIVTFRSDFIEKYPDSVAAIVKAYCEGVDFWKKNPQEANVLVAKELQATPVDTEAQLKTIKILDQHDNDVAFTYASGLQSLYGNLKQMGELGSNNSRQSSTDSDQIIDPRFIKNLSQ